MKRKKKKDKSSSLLEKRTFDKKPADPSEAPQLSPESPTSVSDEKIE